MPITGGPYLASAFFCEKVLREQDGVLSVIRIVDRWNIQGPTQDMVPTVIQAFLVVLFKSGIYRGQANLTVTPISPQNVRMQPIALPVLFEGEDERGAGIVIPMGFPVQEHGTYWFEVALTMGSNAPQVVTAIPMRVAYLQIGPMGPPANPTFLR
jgi:hypothetical protein